MNRIFSTSIFLAKLFVKERTFGLFALLSFFTIILSAGLSGIDIGDKEGRLFKDATLSIQSFALHIVSVFTTLLYLEKERRGGVFIFPLSSGLSRDEYFFSVTVSRVLIVSLLSLFFGSVNSLYLYIFQVDASLNFNLTLLTISSILIASLFLTVAQYTTSLRAMIYTLTLFFMGNGLDELYIYSYKLEEDFQLKFIYDFVSKIIPNFYIFDQDKVSMLNMIHVVFQFLIIYIVGLIKFRNRVLKVEN